MTPLQNEAFTAFLLQKANESEALGYRPALFKQMLNAQGGEATVRQLLSKGKPTDGFLRLWELKRLDLSVEALAVESQWRPFIDDALLRQAEKLLRQLEYPFKPFTTLTMPIPSATPAATALLPALVPVPHPSALPKRPQNNMSFSAFCAWLGAPLVNVADRWCAYNAARGLGVFNLWADRLHGDRYLLWNDAVLSTDSRIGAKELLRNLRQLMAAGHAAYGILSEAKDIDASTRQRSYYDEQYLLVLRLEEEGKNIVAHMLGVILAVDVAANRPGTVLPFDSAIDDLDTPPLGQNAPVRVPQRGGMGYRRDAAIRSYVIQRSNGRCEHCGKVGFELANGSFYVEAHHIIALSAQGPDTLNNVIALCPEHHRQAHYGKNADALEKAFIEKLHSLGQR